MRYLHTVCVLLVGITLTGCQNKQGADGAQSHGAAPVSVVAAVETLIHESNEFAGRLEATETVDIRPRVAGTIDQVHFEAGQRVAKGALLFSLDARPYQAELARQEANLATLKAQLDLARSEWQRGKQLLATQAISQQEFDQLVAKVKTTEASVKGADAARQSAALNVEYSQIRAPIAGRISKANFTTGNLVGVGESVLTTIVAQDKVYAYFDANETAFLTYVGQIPAKQKGAALNLPVQMALANESGFSHVGKIDFVDTRVNPQTGAIRVRAVFDNAQQQYVPGLFARIQWVGKQAYQAVLTPEKAINTDQNKRFVWVVDAAKAKEPQQPQFREVQLGALIDGMRVIQSGVKAGEWVVVNGLQRIRPGASVVPELLKADERGMPLEPLAPVAAKTPPASK
jgi:multidrug efflux system membrane fusion protein